MSTMLKIFIACIIFLLIGLIIWILKPKSKSTHDNLPQKDESFSDAEAKIKEIASSPYYNNLKPLKAHVKDKVVIRSEVGNAGFILYLNDNSWVMAYRKKDEIASDFGLGDPDSKICALINSSDYGNAFDPIGENRPYANEKCNIKEEVEKSHGKKLTGLSHGVSTFNFAFEGSRELDFQLVNDSQEKPSIRIFWEQW
ncbi:MAG: hypothetical protein V1871_08420 [Planctomycetota bacterium]